ncbi:MAG TPA: hypothetical protein VE776_13960 [Actinomycetota bacterium]|jgi:hypothetical protein|nr:hypothetical protein [Actinomycetota bacterium]
MAIDDIRLDDRLLRSDWTIQLLVAGTLLIAAIGIGWLVLAAAADDHVRHVPAIRVQNQTHLTLQLIAIDPNGAQLTLGARPPGTSTVFDVVDMGESWTFVASYGGGEVFREKVPDSQVTSSGWSLVIPANSTTALERQGFR